MGYNSYEAAVALLRRTNSLNVDIYKGFLQRIVMGDRVNLRRRRKITLKLPTKYLQGGLIKQAPSSLIVGNARIDLLLIRTQSINKLDFMLDLTSQLKYFFDMFCQLCSKVITTQDL